MRPILLFLLFALSIITAPGIAVAGPNLLAGGDWYFSAPHPQDAAIASQPSNGTPVSSPTTEVTITEPSPHPWDIQIIRGIPSSVPAGDIVRLHFWAKSPTLNPIEVVIEQTVSPYTWVSSKSIKLSAEWQEFTLDGAAPGYGANGLMVQLQLGEQAGVVDVDGESAVDIGVDPGLADAEKAILPAQVQSRIEKYRKGELTVAVTDHSGHPVRGAVVRVLLKRHAFLFGCNLLGLVPSDTSADQLAYQQRFSALFNYGNLPFFWDSFESQEGTPDYPRLDSIVDWCIKNNITDVGHPLLWQYSLPQWLPSDPVKAEPILKKHITDIINHYHDSVHYWVAINEANSAGQCRPSNGESAWVAKNPAGAVESALQWARDAGSGASETFLYNDFDIGQTNLDLLTKLQADNQLPDVIGIQSHMHAENWPMTKVWETCENFSKFGKPLHFSETTVLSGPNHTITFPGPSATDWNSTPDGESKQADYVAQFYSLLFSCPSVAAISWWDLSDNNAWMGAPAGLLHKDMTPKPAYNRLLDLIHKAWWTDLTGATDSHGSLTQRVFYGQYTVIVTDSSGHIVTEAVNFPESAPPKSITVQLP
jgi:GH35 family endo-1,4-beta-xylanase